MIASSGNHPTVLRKRPYNSIRFWLFMLFGGFSVFMFVAISLVRSFGIPWLEINGSYQDLQGHAVAEFSLVADLKKEHLQLWLQERRSDLDLIAADENMVGAVVKICQARRQGMQKTDIMLLPEYRLLENRLMDTVRQYPSLKAMHLIDPVSRMIVVSSARKFLDLSPDNEEQFLRFAHSSRTNGSWFSASNDFDDSHMDLARRFKNPAGGSMPFAVLVSHVDITEILLPMIHAGKGLGKTGEVILVDHNRQILTPLKHMLPDGQAAQVGAYQIDALPAVLASRGKEGVLFSEDYRGVPVLSCFRHVKIDNDIGWGMIVKQDKSEIEKLAWKRLRMSSLAGLAGLFIALGGCALLARYLAAPIRKFTLATAKLGNGDFSQLIDIETNYKEVVELSSAFNSMTERLRNWDEELNREIAAKTRQLTEELTVRTSAEEALKESEQTLNAIFEAANDGILVADAETHRFVRWNKALCRMLGYSTEELERLSVSDIHPLQSLPQIVAVFEKQVQGEMTMGRDLPVRRKDGSVFSADINSSALLLFGRPHLLGLFRDISERKRADAEREKLMLAIEQSGEAIIVTDAQGTIEYVNPMFESVSGFSRDEVIGQNPRILKSDQHDESFYSEMWAILSSGRIWKGRIVNKRKDGALYTEDTTISPVFDSSRHIVNFVALKRDVTEHIRAAEEKSRVEEQLRQAQKMESVGQLAGGVAHDFNNMLSVILGYGEIILDKLHSDDPLRKDMSVIIDAGRRSAALTRQLLAFSRKQPMKFEVLDINAVILGIESMLHRVIGENIELEKRLHESLFYVKADHGQIEQVIMNLAVNARDAMPTGGKLSIETDNIDLDEIFTQNHPDVQPGKHAVLSISDTGHGMDKETISKIFEPFFTTKEMGKGTGLGLATVYGIVRQSGGTIWVSSDQGKGTTFTIYLPRTQKTATKKQENEEKLWKHAADGENILIVEDENALCELLEQFLSKLGYQVTLGADGNEALRLCEEKSLKPDLVITDVIMPGMSGSMLVQQLRRTQPDIKVLYMSGYTDDAIAHHGVLDKGVHFIQKPFPLENLATKVRELLWKNK